VLTIEFAALDVNTYERQDVFQALWGAASEIACGALCGLVNATLDAEVTYRLGRESHQSRTQSGETMVPWRCHRCGEGSASELKRNGHYSRQLQTTLGTVTGVRVPMVRCMRCGAAADVEFAAVRKHK